MRPLMIDDEVDLAKNRINLSLAMLRVNDLMYQRTLAEANEALANARLLHLCRTGKAYGEDL